MHQESGNTKPGSFCKGLNSNRHEPQQFVADDAVAWTSALLPPRSHAQTNAVSHDIAGSVAIRNAAANSAPSRMAGQVVHHRERA